MDTYISRYSNFRAPIDINFIVRTEHPDSVDIKSKGGFLLLSPGKNKNKCNRLFCISIITQKTG